MTRTLTVERGLVAAAVVGFVAAIYAHTFVLFTQGWHDEENMHGVAVAPIVAFLVWMNWARLKKTPIRRNLPAGLACLGVALVLEVAGIWLGLERSIGYSFVLAVVGLCLYFGGTALTRELAFPLAFLVFMVPTPGGFIDMVSAPLQLLSAHMASTLAGHIGVGVHAEGVNLVIPAKNIHLQVAVGCSGLHSLTAMCMLAALLAYFMAVPTRWKWALFALAVPLALVGNIVRILLVVLVADKHGEAAGLAFHDGLIGKMVPFLVAFLILMTLGRLIERRFARSQKPGPPSGTNPAGTVAKVPALNKV